MVTQSPYTILARDAKLLTDQSERSPGQAVHLQAASAHMAASVHAKAIGDKEKYQEHVEMADRHRTAAVECQAGKQAKVEPLKAGGPGSGPQKTYVGLKVGGGREMFKSEMEPTQESHGSQYHAVIGPFKTDRAAKFMAEHGGNNPHLQSVKDAERISKKYVNASDASNAEALWATATARMTKKAALQASVKDGGYSFSDLQSNIQRAAQDNETLGGIQPNTIGGIGGCCWVADIICPAHEEGETWTAIVQGADGKLYEVSFTIGDGSNVTLSGDPKLVERVTDYDYVFTPDEAAEVETKNALRDAALRAKGELEAGGPGSGPHPGEGKSASDLANKYSSEAAEASKTANVSNEDVDHMHAENMHKEATMYHERAQKVHSELAQKYAGHNEKLFKEHLDLANVHKAAATAHRQAFTEHSLKSNFNASNAAPTPALSAARADEQRKKRYDEANEEANRASGSIAKNHADAASLHSIAAEHASMAGLDAEKADHMVKYHAHLEACEAHKASPMMPKEVKADDAGDGGGEGDMIAKGAGKTGLEAGGPGSGPHPSGNIRVIHPSITGAEPKNLSGKEYAGYLTQKANEATTKANDTKDVFDHAEAKTAHDSAAEANKKWGTKEQAESHKQQAVTHWAEVTKHFDATK